MVLGNILQNCNIRNEIDGNALYLEKDKWEYQEYEGYNETEYGRGHIDNGNGL